MGIRYVGNKKIRREYKSSRNHQYEMRAYVQEIVLATKYAMKELVWNSS